MTDTQPTIWRRCLTCGSITRQDIGGEQCCRCGNKTVLATPDDLAEFQAQRTKRRVET